MTVATAPTFEWQGKRLKNISHKNLFFHTKDAPLLVRFNKTGDSQYGPFATFEVMGDMSGEYFYKPAKDAPDQTWWPAMKAQIDAVTGDFVSVTAQFDGDYPALRIEDEMGTPIEQAPPKVHTPTPSRQAEVVQAMHDLENSRAESHGHLMAECIAAAEKAVQSSEVAFTSEDVRAIALSIYIQMHR